MNRVRIITQCRLASSRLPGKALLSIAGYPSVVLSALRAANTGLDVVVATSTESSDDQLVNVLQTSNIKFYRGDLNDVLERLAGAASDLEDDDIIVRLTADNIFPDGVFIQRLINIFLDKSIDYLVTSVEKGFPYGVSVEIFRVGLLRLADKTAIEEERFPPTKWLKSNSRVEFIENDDFFVNDYSELNCTLDEFNDYQRLLSVFSVIPDPISVSIEDLVAELVKQSMSMINLNYVSNIRNKMVLGTAQLGLDYGINNTEGMPSKEISKTIIAKAFHTGVKCFDTARAYGIAEAILGDFFTDYIGEKPLIITKLDPLKEMIDSAEPAFWESVVESSIYKSCRELRTQSIDVLMLHRWEHRWIANGIVWNKLIELKREGLITNLGVSVYSPKEAIQALEHDEIKYIQLPFNLLDPRWKESGFLDLLEERQDIKIHVRSIFLQGVLLADSKVWPKIPGLDAVAVISKLDKLVEKLGRKNRADLCHSYVRAMPWVDGVIVGVEKVEQLEDNFSLFEMPGLQPDEVSLVESELHDSVPLNFLVPPSWPK